MAQSGFTPIQLYYSTTSAAAPTPINLASGELAINITDGKLYYKDNLGAVQTIADKAYSTRVTTISFGLTGLTPSTATSGAVTVGGTLAVGNGGTGLTAGTSGGVPYYSASNTLASSAALAASSLVVGGGAGAAPSTVTTGTGVVTALGVNTGSAGAFVVNGGVLGTPSSGTVTNLTGTASININGTVGATTANTGTFTRLVSGVTSASGFGSVTPASDSCNQINVSIVSGDISFLAPSGTPASGQKLLIRIIGDTVSRNITSWNAIYRVIGTILPTTVAANKTVYVGCIYNESSATWDVVAVTTQA